MKRSLLEIQVFYEIAMSIGNSLDINKMLQESLTAYLRKLNCSAGAVFTLEQGPGQERYLKKVYSIPREVTRNKACIEALKQVPEDLSGPAWMEFTQRLPLQGPGGRNDFFHIFQLPNFGILLLVKSNLDLEPSVLKSLKHLNARLAGACIACFQNETITRYNERLKIENHERKLLEEKLRESTERYRSLFRDNHAVMLIVDPSTGNITDANPAACEFYGYKHDQLTRKKMSDIQVPQKNLDIEASPFADPGQPFFRHVPATGEVRDVEVSSGPIRIDNRELTFSIIHDVTHRIRAEAALLKAKKIEATGVLAGGMAHDFNNLLSIILGNLSMAKEDTKPGNPISVRLEAIEVASLKARDLTQKFITFSAGGTPVRQPVYIKELVENIVSMECAGSQFNCRLSFPTDLWLVEVDTGQMRQVLYNVLQNAREAMPKGGSIIITAENFRRKSGTISNVPLPEGDYVNIVIRDNGGGIPADKLPYIFDPYFSTKQRGAEKGMGLGLTIAFAIVRKHGGLIHIESEYIGGTEVIISLPRYQSKTSVDAGNPERPAKEIKGRIMVLEPEELMRNLYRNMLIRLGYEVVPVAGREEAVEAYERSMGEHRRFDVVILDVTSQAEVNGTGVLEGIMGIDPTVNAIATSGYADDPVVSGFRMYGFKAALVKPFMLSQLKETLDKVMEE